MIRQPIMFGLALWVFALAAGAQASTPEENDLNAIVIPNQHDIRGNINLPPIGLINRTPISWKSSDPRVVSTDSKNGMAAGVVSRPRIAALPSMVTLTATAGAYQKSFILTVQPRPKEQKLSHYLFAYFTSGSAPTAMDEQIYFATSSDVIKWCDLSERGRPALVSTIGEAGARDPFILRSAEGDRFFILATDLSAFNRAQNGTSQQWKTNGSKSILIWETRDLGQWGKPRLVELSAKIPGAGYTWAPEAIWDPKRGHYIVFWATRSELDNAFGSPENMYYSTTRDFVSFTAPVKWVDRASYAIDATMMRVGDWWYRAYGNAVIEKTKWPYAAVSEDRAISDSSDEWKSIGKPIAFGSAVEGPEFFRFNSSDIKTVSGRKMRYGLMVDRFSTGQGYVPVRTSDPGSGDPKGWIAADDIDFGSILKRHGSILPITDSEYRAILESFGRSNYSRDCRPR